MPRIKVDQNFCIGCGTCVALCPQVYQLNNQGKAEVKEKANYSACEIQETVDSCPAGAISLNKE